ncbi:hypothetical protein SEVIR_5G002600v4 [Setaria viridis]|nr:serine/arginine repetitive matrix protein 1 [Setaria viridis]
MNPMWPDRRIHTGWIDQPPSISWPGSAYQNRRAGRHKTTRTRGSSKTSQTTHHPIPISHPMHHPSAHNAEQSRAAMSSPPPPPPKDHSKGRSPALELLDEYWFFSNTLANSNNKPPRSPNNKDWERREDSKGSCSAGLSRLYASGGRRLLRTPSLPSPSKLSKDVDDDDLAPVAARRQDAAGSGNRQQQQEEHEVEEDDLNWSSIYEGVLRTRMAEGANNSGSRSALRRAPSMPVPSSSATGQAKPTPTSTRRRPSPRSMSASQQPVLPRSKSGVFRAEDKKWRSSGDLESIEVQGFRDLGFVFDKEDLRESLAGVLPGLKQQAAGKTGRSRSSSGRPYLSEAWQRPPALVRVQSEARSAAEVKDQLRMWAQAVACNVRQEC